MAQPFVFLELNAPSAYDARSFYETMFGWSFTQPEPGGNEYSLFRPDKGAAGAIYSAPGVASRWLPYINVENIHEATEQALSLGARLIRGIQEIPGHGWTTIMEDPWGAPMALFQNAAS